MSAKWINIESKRIRWLDNIINTMDTSLSKLRKIVKDSEARRVAVYTCGGFVLMFGKTNTVFQV